MAGTLPPPPLNGQATLKILFFCFPYLSRITSALSWSTCSIYTITHSFNLVKEHPVKVLQLLMVTSFMEWDYKNITEIPRTNVYGIRLKNNTLCFGVYKKMRP